VKITARTLSIFIGFIIISILIFNNFRQKSESPVITGPYLGQKPPGLTPEKFAPDIISIEEGKEYKPTISPDATEIFFMRRTPGGRDDCIWTSKLEGGKLTEPHIAGFSYQCFEGQPCFTPDGNRLFYMTCRPFPGESSPNALPYLWYVDRTDNGWSEPQYYASEIGEHHPAQISMTNDGTVYFVSNTERKIYFSEYQNGEYTEPELLQCGANDLDPIGHPAISPNEEYLIVDQVYRESGMLVSNMWICFRNADGTWTSPQSMRDILHMSDGELPMMANICFSKNIMRTRINLIFSGWIPRLLTNYNGLTFAPAKI
jgi:hypothetical protein